MKQGKEIARAMIELTKEQPIVNAGSFAKTLLWQIFEVSEERMECKITLHDEDIEAVFAENFKTFIEGYPNIMALDS